MATYSKMPLCGPRVIFWGMRDKGKFRNSGSESHLWYCPRGHTNLWSVTQYLRASVWRTPDDTKSNLVGLDQEAITDPFVKRRTFKFCFVVFSTNWEARKQVKILSQGSNFGVLLFCDLPFSCCLNRIATNRPETTRFALIDYSD